MDWKFGYTKKWGCWHTGLHHSSRKLALHLGLSCQGDYVIPRDNENGPSPVSQCSGQGSVTASLANHQEPLIFFPGWHYVSYSTARKKSISNGLRQSDIVPNGRRLRSLPSQCVRHQGLRKQLRNTCKVQEPAHNAATEGLAFSPEWGMPRQFTCCWWTDRNGKRFSSPTPAVGLHSLGAGVVIISFTL